MLLENWKLVNAGKHQSDLLNDDLGFKKEENQQV